MIHFCEENGKSVCAAHVCGIQSLGSVPPFQRFPQVLHRVWRVASSKKAVAVNDLMARADSHGKIHVYKHDEPNQTTSHRDCVVVTSRRDALNSEINPQSS